MSNQIILNGGHLILDIGDWDGNICSKEEIYNSVAEKLSLRTVMPKIFEY